MSKGQLQRELQHLQQEVALAQDDVRPYMQALQRAAGRMTLERMKMANPPGYPKGDLAK